MRRLLLLLPLMGLLLVACAENVNDDIPATRATVSLPTVTTGGFVGEEAPELPTLDETISPADLTSTALVAQATASAGDADSQSAIAPDCTPGTRTAEQPELTEAVQEALNESEIQNAFAAVVTTEDTFDCQTYTEVSSFIAVDVEAPNLTATDELADTAYAMLGVLDDALPVDEVPGEQPAVLSLRFSNDGQQRVLQTNYADALDTFQLGTRGTDLFEALGGLSEL